MLSFQKLFQEADELCGITKTVPIPQEDTSLFEALYHQQEEMTTKQLRHQIAVSDLEKLRNMVQQISLPSDNAAHNNSVNCNNDNVVLGINTKQIIFPIISNLDNLLSLPSVKLPYYEWETEVREMMGITEPLLEGNNKTEFDSDEEHQQQQEKAKSQRVIMMKPRNQSNYQQQLSAINQSTAGLLVFPSRAPYKIEVDIAPYRCFDTDYIDVNYAEDPLDRIFHNIPGQDLRHQQSIDENNYEGAELKGKEKEKEENLKVKEKEKLMKLYQQSPSKLREKLFRRFTKNDQLIAQQEDDESNLLFSSTFSFLSPEEEARRLKQLKEKQRLQEKIDRIKGIDTWMDASTTLVKSSSSSAAMKRTRDMALHSRLKTMIASFNHSTIALTHCNTRPDLKEIDLKYFHRPRMLKERDRPWIISLKQKSSHRKTKQIGGEIGKVVIAEEDKQNLSLTHSDSSFILLEYIEEFPPLVLNYGMASYIVNYFRSTNESAQELEGSGGRVSRGNRGDVHLMTDNISSGISPVAALTATPPPRKMQKASPELSLTNNANMIEKIKQQLAGSNTKGGGYRLPRHVMLLWELNNIKRSYEHDANIPKQKIGSTKILNPDDTSPFLGNIEEGDLQPSFENNLFRSPLFSHTPASTDFLLIRTKTMNNLLSYSIRNVPYLFLSGQIEPQLIVPHPMTKITATQEKLYLLSIVRYLSSHQNKNNVNNGVYYQELMDNILKYSSKEKLAPHKYYHRKNFKDILKKVSDEIRDNSVPTNLATGINTGFRYFLKEFNDPDLESQFSVDNIARSISPEEICIQESCNAAEYRLIQSNITDIELSKLLIYLNYLHDIKQFHKDRIRRLQDYQVEFNNKTVYQLSSSTINEQYINNVNNRCEKLQKFFLLEIHRIDIKQSISRFILERLITTPWSITEAFVNSVIKMDNLGKMNVRGGKGDPSGRGEAFAFVRLPPITPGSLGGGIGGGVGNGTSLMQRRKEEKDANKLVGTDKDLRKLTKKDAIDLCEALGMKRSEAESLERWDRIHVIREMVNKLIAKGVGLDGVLAKYARDPNLMNSLKNAKMISSAASSAGQGSGGRSGNDGRDLSHEEFQQICNEIWNRQKNALSSTIPPTSQEGGEDVSGADRGGGGDKAVNKEVRRREKKKLRRQESSLGSPRSPYHSLHRTMSSSSEDENEEKTNNDEDDEDIENSSDESDLAEDIEKRLSARAVTIRNHLYNNSNSNSISALNNQSAAAERLEQEKLFEELKHSLTNGPSNITTPANALVDPSKQLKKKISISGGGGGGSGNTPRSVTPATAILVAGGVGAEGNTVPIAQSSSSSMIPCEASGPAVPSSFSLPTANKIDHPPQIMKRLIKYNTIDGREMIRIEFIFIPTEVQKLQATLEQRKHERMEKRTMTALSHPFFIGGGGGGRRGKGGQGGHFSSIQEMMGMGGMEGDSDDELLLSNPTMSLSLGKLKEKIDQHHQIQNITSHLPLTKKEKQLLIKPHKAFRGGSAGVSGMKDEELEFIVKSKTFNKRSSPFSSQQYYLNPRLPRVSLAIRLEREVMNIWNNKDYELFKYSVDPALYPSYYTIIERPICLSDIREKVVTYRYESLDEFLKDFQLMLENSERFNGVKHLVTILARKIYDTMKLDINHEKEVCKPDKDYFTKLEELILQKKSFYKRGLLDLAGVQK